MKHLLRISALYLVVGTPASLICQASPDLGKGLTPFTIYNSTSIDNVNMTNSNVYVHIPLLSYPQRGKALALSFSITANARVWGCGYFPGDGTTDSAGEPCVWGMSDDSRSPTVSDTFLGAQITFDQGGTTSPSIGYLPCVPPVSDPGAGCSGSFTFENWAYYSSDGGAHYFYSGPVNEATFPGYTYGGYPATDGSGYSNPSSEANGPVIDRHGVSFGDYQSDADGNQIWSTFTNSDMAASYTDTLGRTIPGPSGGSTAVSTSNCPTSAIADSATQWIVPGPSTANGGQEKYFLCYRSIMPTPEFPGHTVVLPRVAPTVLVAIVLPDQTYYLFGYDNFLELTHLRLPTGGTVDYTFVDIPEAALTAQGYVLTDDWQARVIASRTTSDGVNAPATTNYAWGTIPQKLPNGAMGGITVLTDPLGNDEVHFVGPGAGGDWASAGSTNDVQTDSYQGCSPYKGVSCTGSGQLLKSVARVYQTLSTQTSAQLVAAGGPVSRQSRILSETTSIPSSTGTPLVTQKVYTYVPPQVTFLVYNVYAQSTQNCPQCGEFNQVRSVAEYDYGSGSPGPLLKQTTTYYKWEDSTPSGKSTVGAQYLAANLVDLPMYVRVVGTGLTEETDYYYDEHTPQSSSGVATQNSGVLGPVRGQLTSVSRSLNGSGTEGKPPKSPVDPTTQTYWYDTGVPYQTIDPNGNPTTYSYDAAYGGAYVTKTVDPLGDSVSAKYDYNTGAMTSFTGINSATTTFTYDALVRPLNVLYADGGQHNITYNVTSTPGNVVIQDSIDRSRLDEHTIIYDGFGRETETQHNTDVPSASYVDTSYDQNGHPWIVSNPYRSKSNPTSEATYGVTKTYYDALGRQTSSVLPDGATTSTSFSTMPYTWLSSSGNTIYYGMSKTYTDPRGNKTVWASNAGGFLGATVENSTAAGSLPALTTVYTYNGTDLTGVQQQGDGSSASSFRTRTFGYDSLTRLTYSLNPEAGAISYNYDLNSNLTTKTDARNTVTTYSYDALNRLTSKTYTSDAAKTPFSCYQYGTTAGYSLERLTLEWTEPPSSTPCASSSNALTSKAFSTYDSRGRVINEQQCVGKVCSQNVSGSNTYSYDLAGHLLTFGNLVGTGQFANSYDSAGRLLSITESWSGGNTAPLYPNTLFSGATYTPHGALWTAMYGANLSLSRMYDSRLHIFSESDSGVTVQQPALGSAGGLSITGGVQSK